MTRLHHANERFHEAQARLKDLDKMGFKQRRELAAALRAAQREIDDVTRQIDEILQADDAPAA
jgi:hypothetical protein